MLALLTAGLGLLASGCEHELAGHASASAASAREATESHSLVRQSAQVAVEYTRARQRLEQQLPLPRRLRMQRCPDRSIEGWAETDRTLLLRSQDSRIVRKKLLPLLLTAHLSSHDLLAVRQYLSGADGDFSDALLGRPASPKAARMALAELSALERRRFAGIYHVIRYGAPRLIHKIGRRRPEWVPGILDTWLAIYELYEDRPLCQVRVTVRNDTRDAPIRRRLKSQTRERLIRELGGSLRARSRIALSRISSALRMPVVAVLDEKVIP